MRWSRWSLGRRSAWSLAASLLLAVACGDDGTPPSNDEPETTGPASTGGSAGVATDGMATEGLDETGPAEGSTGGTEGETEPGPVLDCSVLAEGTVTGFMVDGMSREFILNLPDGVEDGGPWPVVFNWHGLGDTAQNMSGLVSGQVNNSVMPFIAVTPEDTDFILDVPIPGLPPMDWEVFAVDEANNRELKLFDAVLTCLDERYGVDPEHVHSMGFSLGGILTDMLVSLRSDQIASVATYSGGYWNNPANVDALLGTAVMWPPYAVEHGYAQLLLHGGPTDLFDLSVIQLHFDEYAEADATFLGEQGHDTIVCNHGQGHSAPVPGMGPEQLIQFFADHPYSTTASPYAAGLPGSFADYCELRGQGG